MNPTVQAWLSGEMPDRYFADWLEQNGVDMEAATKGMWYPLRLREFGEYAAWVRVDLWEILLSDYPHLEHIQ